MWSQAVSAFVSVCWLLSDQSQKEHFIQCIGSGGGCDTGLMLYNAGHQMWSFVSRQLHLFTYCFLYWTSLLPLNPFLLVLWSPRVHTPSLTLEAALLWGHRTLLSQSLMGTSWVHQQAQKRVRNDWLLAQRSCQHYLGLTLLVENSSWS